MSTSGEKKDVHHTCWQTDASLCSHQTPPGCDALVASPFKLLAKGHSLPNSHNAWWLLYVPVRIGSTWAGVWWGVENSIVYMKSWRNEGGYYYLPDTRRPGRQERKRGKQTRWVRLTAKHKHLFLGGKAKNNSDFLLYSSILSIWNIWYFNKVLPSNIRRMELISKERLWGK